MPLANDEQDRLESLLVQLAGRFVERPFDYFSERELQAEFYALARGAFGEATVADGNGRHHTVSLFRHEYNTLGRYRGGAKKEAFLQRYSRQGEGDVGALDFAVLERAFAEANKLLTVINKDETCRALLRAAVDAGHKPAILAAGVEFKMAHVSKQAGGEPTTADLNQLEAGLLADCRKLAHERPGIAYAIAFSHTASIPNAGQVLARARGQFMAHHPKGDVRLALIARETAHIDGAWRSAAFPSLRP
ncbi:MAG: hypothetical protein JNK64_11030 [Myxococcales bacterium]|nr:hypothetical protein [Myxococcales bacterium]